MNTNTHILAAEIVSKIRNSMQDSSLNQEVVVAGMIREAVGAELKQKDVTFQNGLPWWDWIILFLWMMVMGFAFIFVISEMIKSFKP